MLILNKKTGWLESLSALGLALSAGCVKPEAPKEAVTAQAADEVASPQRFGLIGQGPAYLLQQPAATSSKVLIAEVKLAKEGEDLTPAYAYDGEVTGETVYTVVAPKLAIATLRRRLKAGKDASFTGDLERGYSQRTGDSFMHQVTMKVLRTVEPRGLGPEQRSCPWTLFGNQQELFALETEPVLKDSPQLVKLRLRRPLFSRSEAGRIKQGLCLRQAAISAEPLEAHKIYAMQTGLAGALSELQIEVLEKLPFNPPPVPSR